MGEGVFVEAATPYGLDSIRDARGLAASDFDGDGDVDLIVNNYNRPAHYFANDAARGNWLRVRLRGRTSNRDGIGATVRVETGTHRQMRVVTAGSGYASQSSRTVHFGLGTYDTVDLLEIKWPGGDRGSAVRQSFRDVSVNRLLVIDEHEHELFAMEPSR